MRVIGGKESSSRSEDGGISIQSLISLLAFILVAWGLVAFFPNFHVPVILEDNVEERVLEFLRLTRPEKAKPATKRKLEKDIVEIVKETLADHRVDEEAVKKGISIRGTKVVQVKFNYTIIIEFIGMEFTFDKELDLKKQATNF